MYNDDYCISFPHTNEFRSKFITTKNSLIKIANAADDGDGGNGGDGNGGNGGDGGGKGEKEKDVEDSENDNSDSTNDSTNEDSTEEETKTEETESSEVAAVSDKAETPEATAPQEATVPDTTIAPEATSTSNIGPVTDGGQAPEEVTREITENQESNQDPEISGAKLQQVADQITENLIQEEELSPEIPEHIKTIFSNELKNNPNGDLSKSMEVLAGMNELFVFKDEPTKKIAEMIITKYPQINKLTILPFTQMVLDEVGKKWNRILDITIKEIYDPNGDLVTKVLTEVAADKSSDNKRDKNSNN